MSRASESQSGANRGAAPGHQVLRWIRYDRRYEAPFLITCILLGAHLSFGVLESFAQTLLAIAVAFATEALLARAVRGRWPHFASAYITGISIGILTRSPLYWPFALGSALSITSKYVLRLRGNHLWNPSNLGICVLFLLAPYAVAPLSVQWGNELWPMVVIWILGTATLWRHGRLHIVATYVVSFFIFAALRAEIAGLPLATEVAPITGPMYQLFVFFMITDPRTTVHTTRGRCLVTVAVAAVEAILRLAEVIYAPFYALFIVGPAAMAIERLWTDAGER